LVRRGKWTILEEKIKSWFDYVYWFLNKNILLSIMFILVAIILAGIFGRWEGLTAVGTIGMALVIMLIELILPRFNQPVLQIEFQQNNSQYCTEAPLHHSFKLSNQFKTKVERNSDIPKIPASDVCGEFNLKSPVGSSNIFSLSPEKSDEMAFNRSNRNKWGYFLRIRVKNEGRGVAKKCRGVVVDITQNGRTITYFSPLILRWANRPLDLIHDTIDLNQGEYWFLDVFFSVPNDPNLYFHHIYLGKAVGVKYWLKKGKYEISITVYAENAQPKNEKFFVEWTGRYKDIKMRKKSQECVSNKFRIIL